MADDTRSTFTLRTNRELLDRLKAAADARSHSMNAEIVQRLEASLSQADETARVRAVAVPTDLQLSAEGVEWLGIWNDMNDSQRRRALAMLRAVIDADAV